MCPVFWVHIKNLDLKDLIIKATDKEDGDLKDKVKILDDGGFNKDKVGVYKITFKVTDKEGLSGKKISTVKVVEKKIKNKKEKLPKTSVSNTSILTSILSMVSIIFLKKKNK